MGGLAFDGPGLDGLTDGANQLNLNERRMRAMENSVNEGFGAGVSNGGAPSMYNPFGPGVSASLPLGSTSAAASQGMPYGDGQRNDDLTAALLDPFGPGSGYNFDMGGLGGLDSSLGGFGSMHTYGMLSGGGGNDAGGIGGSSRAMANTSAGAQPQSNGGSGSGGRGTPSAGFHIPGSTPLDSTGMLGASPVDTGAGWLSYSGPGSVGGSGPNSAPGMSPAFGGAGSGSMFPAEVRRSGSDHFGSSSNNNDARGSMPPPQQQRDSRTDNYVSPA